MTDEIVILSPEDSALDAFCMAHRTNLVTLQRAIEKNEGKPGKRELERRLGRMRKALLAKNTDAAEGWLYALVDGIKAVDVWIEKTSGKIKQEKALTPERRVKGGATTKAKAQRKMEALEQAVSARPRATPKQFGALADELGLSEEVIIKKVRAIRNRSKNG